MRSAELEVKPRKKKESCEGLVRRCLANSKLKAGQCGQGGGDEVGAVKRGDILSKVLQDMKRVWDLLPRTRDS